MSRLLRYLTALVLCCAFFGAAFALQHKMIDDWRKRPYQFRDALYLPSSEYVKIVSLGYDQFLADFLWLRMIQSFAAGWSRPENAEQMKHYFEVITDLDPRFTDAYSFAIMAVGEEGKRDDFVQEIVTKSVVQTPGEYKVPYEGAFYANWNMSQPELAKLYVRMAKLDPTYPDFIDRWEGYFDLKQGRYRAAYEKYLADYLQAIQDNNYKIYAIFDRNMRRAIDSWFKSEILERAKAFRAANGRSPSVQELNDAGAFRGIKLPNVQMIEGFITQYSELPVGQRTMTEDEMRGFCEKAINTFDTLPWGPWDSLWPRDPGYVIWQHWEPDNENYILSHLEAASMMQRAVRSLNAAAAEKQTENQGVCPQTIAEFAKEFAETPDPFGQPWQWDPQRCEADTVRYPGIFREHLPESF